MYAPRISFGYERVKSILNIRFREESWFRDTLSYVIARYTSIEERTVATFRYVDLDPKNASSFSYEYASILRDAGSCFASTLDRLVRLTRFNLSRREFDILDYRKFLTASVPNIHSICLRVSYARSSIYLRPFSALGQEQEKIEWWDAYNKIKHSEIDMFREGNLVNSLNAVASLAVIYALMDFVNGASIRLFDEIGFVEPENAISLCAISHYPFDRS